MILILSGQYLDQSFNAEFGEIPPTFIPLCNTRLFQHQIENLQRNFPDEQIYISLPENFQLDISSRNFFNKNSIKIIFSNIDLSIGEAVLYCLNFISDYTSNLRILYGDTLIESTLPLSEYILTAETIYNYKWETVKNKNSRSIIWAGFFSLHNIPRFAGLLTKNRYNFINSIKEYFQNSPQKYIFTKDWYDVGHLYTYHEARSKFTSERAFNRLKIQKGILFKTSTNITKVRAEANWFLSLPDNLKSYVPAFYSKEKTGYKIEYLPLIGLNEIWVHGSQPIIFWDRVFDNIVTLLKDFQKFSEKSFDVKPQFHDLIMKKTNERLGLFHKQNIVDIECENFINGKHVPSLKKISDICIKKSLSLYEIPSIMHGDLCLSNILWDPRSNRIKIIDPLGTLKNNAHGPQNYDIAKLLHSLVGGYDYIIAGHFTLDVRDNYYQFDLHHKNIEQQLINLIERKLHKLNIEIKDYYPLVTLLFISMLPLHSDSAIKQQAIFANILRLYSELIVNEGS